VAGRFPPAARVEFIIDASPCPVKLAQLVACIDSGPLGDDLPTPLLTIQTVDDDDNEAS